MAKINEFTFGGWPVKDVEFVSPTKTKTKVYIAGKITGDPNYKEKFLSYQALLEAAGHIVLSPATLPEGMRSADYMRICFAMIDCADLVVFLPDYAQSPGARLEREYCKYTDKLIATVEVTAL